MTIQHLVMTGVAGATGALGVVAQVPSQDLPGGDYSKYGIIGILGVTIGILILYGLPTLLASHKENYSRLADEVKDGNEKTAAALEKQTAAINAGNDRQATLLQSTLHQLFKERRNGK